MVGVRLLSLLAYLASVLALAPAAFGQTNNAWAISAEVERVARGLDAQFQAALIKERRLADDRELVLIAESAARLAKMRADYDLKIAGADAALQIARSDYAKLVESVAARNASVSAEIAAYRTEVRGLASAASAERLEALQRFADGDRQRSWAILEALRLSEDRAAEAASNVRRAVRWRQDADLREIMRANGEATVVQVLELRLKAGQLDGADFWNEIYTGRLLVNLGQMQNGWLAAQRALNLAATDDERVIALVDMGDAHWAGGYWDAARSTYWAAADISRKGSVKDAYTAYVASTRFTSRLFDADQNTVLLLREYLARVASEGIAPEKVRRLIETLPVTKDPPADAVSAAEQVLLIEVDLWAKAASDPQSQQGENWSWVNRQLSIAYGELAFLRFMQGRWDESADLHRQELIIDRKRVERDPAIVNRQHLASSLQSLADSQLLHGDYALARQNYMESMAIIFGLFQSDPNNSEYSLPYATALFRAGALLLLEKDYSRARQAWTLAKTLIEALAERSPEARADEFQLMAANLLLSLLPEAS